MSDQHMTFSNALRYRQFISHAAGRVRERQESPLRFSYTERHLQCVWFDDRWRPLRLRTTTGEKLTVKSPGRWNLEAGPDFRDAVIEIGPERRTLRGDIEVHIRPESWLAHGHQGDPRYRAVVLHLTYFPGDLPEGTLPDESVSCVLKPALGQDPTFSFEALDVTSYPFCACPAGSSACQDIVKSWSSDQRGALLDAAGEERLQRKTERLMERLTEISPSQLLYEETMGALGYKHNRSPFRVLAQRVPLGQLLVDSEGNPLTAYAILLGVAGLLPPRMRKDWDNETREFMRVLWDDWWKRRSRWQSREMDSPVWRCAGQRPHNHPIRRMAAAAGLFAGPESPLDALPPLPPETDPRRWFHLAAAQLRERMQLPYWLHRITLGGKPQSKPVLLMGPRRLAALLTNVVIPFLAATGADVRPLIHRLPREEDNACIRQMAHTLFGRDHNPQFHSTGIRQQGLLQIFHDFCLTNREGCRGCRLLRALKRRQSRAARRAADE